MVKQAVDAPQLDRQEFAIDARKVFVEEPVFSPRYCQIRYCQTKMASAPMVVFLCRRIADTVTQQLRHEYPVQHGNLWKAALMVIAVLAILALVRMVAH